MTPSPIRVVLLEDHDIVRTGVRALLDSAEDIEVVGEARTIAEAELVIRDLQPDVAVLDARLPDGSGVDLCARLDSISPKTRAMMLTSFDDDALIVSAIKAGAAGYVLKQVEGLSLLSTVRTIAKGHSTIDPDMFRRVITRIEAEADRPPELTGLSEQQLRILELLGQGLTNREIGARMYLAEKTVKNNVTRILASLGVQRRTQAAVLATRLLEQRSATGR